MMVGLVFPKLILKWEINGSGSNKSDFLLYLYNVICLNTNRRTTKKKGRLKRKKKRNSYRMDVVKRDKKGEIYKDKKKIRTRHRSRLFFSLYTDIKKKT